jgi:succinate dehydrogenase hydrophobic anchor subunit
MPHGTTVTTRLNFRETVPTVALMLPIRTRNVYPLAVITGAYHHRRVSQVMHLMAMPTHNVLGMRIIMMDVHCPVAVHLNAAFATGTQVVTRTSLTVFVTPIVCNHI